MSVINKTKSLIDTIASNNGYRQKNALCKRTDLLKYPKSRDAIASNKDDELPTTTKRLGTTSINKISLAFYGIRGGGGLNFVKTEIYNYY